MLIFTKVRQIPNEYLEYRGIKNVVTFNLSSYDNSQTLNFLVPSPEFIPESILCGDVNSMEFDMAYHGYIINNDNAFMQLMQIIILLNMYPDTLVQILIGDGEYRLAITESLAKLIQQRYGYNSYIINSAEDFLYTEESTFSIPGLFIYDSDLKRWHAIAPEVEVYSNESYLEQ